MIKTLTMLPLALTLIGAQTVQLEGTFFEYATYYISNFNTQTGASDVSLFHYRIHSDTYPVYVKIRFRSAIRSPGLGVSEEEVLVDLESKPMRLVADLLLDNRNFNVNTTILYDQASPPNAIPIRVVIQESIDASRLEPVLSSLITTGQLPDGEYKFEIQLYAGPSETELSLADQEAKTIVVQTATAITLESPGGTLADTLETVLYITYPVFDWYSQGCTNCESYIRVAEFDPSRHSSVDEAIEDETVLPADQAQGWESVGTFSTYQYPIAGVRPLEFGKTYVWQVQNILTTTAGPEPMLSSIYAFKIIDPSGGTARLETFHPVIQSLQQALGEDRFNALFGTGSDLEGFVPTGIYTVDGATVDESSVAYILNQIANQNLTVSTVRVED